MIRGISNRISNRKSRSTVIDRPGVALWTMRRAEHLRRSGKELGGDEGADSGDRVGWWDWCWEERGGVGVCWAWCVVADSDREVRAALDRPEIVPRSGRGGAGV